ncbi:MAG: SusC/RagA family TonB-linked outer membrane protein [Ichthyobacteriaceae bacterium]|nr:SusC/RagA family TonB-linked outer membrane protein [Ichthyobacteriaceae bacterium]
MRFNFTGLMALLITLFAPFAMMAQELQVSGTVTSSEDGLPMPGVSIVKVGTTEGTSADFDGNFSITANKGDKLEFSFIGYSNKQVTVESETLQVVLSPDAQALDEVVVTALGISRDKKSLGYAMQEVGGDELNKAKSDNIVNSISGKVSGVQVKTNTNMGGSSNIVIRGSSSLMGNNQALFVIDGIPVNNSTNNEKGQTTGRSGYDYGNPVSDINPDDIESMSVLKGAAATALYGSRAANGVIVITTKKGKNSDKSVVSVGINSGIMVGVVDRSTFPKYQTQYGSGYGPYYSGGDHPGLSYNDETKEYTIPLTEDASFGEKFDENLMVRHWDSFYPDSPTYGQTAPYVNTPNGPISFLNNSLSLTNGFNIGGGTKTSTFYLSYTNTNQSGIIPNSTINKNNVTLNGSYKLSEKVKVSASANYTNTKGKGRNTTGYSGNMMSAFRQWWQVNVDMNKQEEMYDLMGTNATWNPKSSTNLSPIYWNNFYFQVYENFQNDERNRIMGYAQLDWDITEDFSFMSRASIDTYNTLQEERLSVGSTSMEFGVGRPDATSGYAKKSIFFAEVNMDAMFKYNKYFTEDLSFTALAGTNIRRTRNDLLSVSTNGGLAVPGVYSLANSVDPMMPPEETKSEIGVNGLFASASLGYNNMIFIDGTIRRDVSSTLPEDNNAFVYPSVSASFLFTDLVSQDWLSLGKLRVNYAQVGNDAPWGSIQDTYSIEAPFNGNPMVGINDTKLNSELRPEISSSIETGVEMNFFNNRLGFDFAYYKTNTVDQIVPLAVSFVTGYRSKYVNAGEVENSGIELMIQGTPIKTNDFAWNVMVNYSRNRNKVISLGEGVENLQIASLQGGVSINATVGMPYGVIQGTDFVYDNNDENNPDGFRADDANKVVGANGYYKVSSTSDKIVGNINPDFMMGINNSFTYKNWSASFLFDSQIGGQLYSLDQNYGLATGLYAETAFDNDLDNPVRNATNNGGGFINPGVSLDRSGNYVTNTKRVAGNNFRAFGYARKPVAAFIYDATYVKLREASISYSLNKSAAEKIGMKGATLSLVGSNLWILYKELPHADPEASQGAGNIQGWQSGVMPTTRNFGFNVNLQF